MKVERSLDSLTELIINAGIKNVRFLVKMHPIERFLYISYTSSSTPMIPMLCEIDESRYKIEDNYKITLKSIEQIKGINGKEHYYISDLRQLINDGVVKMMVEINEDNENLFNSK